MADQWHYFANGRQFGPVPLKRLKELVDMGVVGPSSEVWQEGTPDWVLASSVPILFPDDRIKAKETSSRTSTILEEPTPASIQQPRPPQQKPSEERQLERPSNLRPCPDCGHMISLRAAACPKCGAPQKEHTSSKLRASGPHSSRADGLGWYRLLESLGVLMLLGGICGAVYFFFIFDTTVVTEPVYILGQSYGGGQRVHNLGLMADRQNGIVISMGAALLGGVFLLAGHLMTGRRQAEAKHKSVKEAYFSKGGMGLLDLIPGLRDAPGSVKWVLLVVAVILGMVVFHLIAGH